MTKSLYISYDGLLEPLGQSQIIPYLKGLSANGISFVLLTFDKKEFNDRETELKLRQELLAMNIRWRSLPYHKNPPIFSKVFDIAHGLVVSLFTVSKNKIEVIHARGYVPGLIALFLKKIFKVKFIFDMRGFWADIKVEGGHWSHKSSIYKVAKFFEDKFIRNADRVVVLTGRAKKILEEKGYNVDISIVPCCVDVDTFQNNSAKAGELRKSGGLEGKFILAHTGSLEGWYMKSEMLDYFKVAKVIIPNAHFIILSQSPKEPLLRLIAEKGLNLQDFTLKAVPFKQMPDYLSMVDAGFLFLSLKLSGAACFPTKFAEFLSCGIPVIANADIGDTEMIIKQNRIGTIISDFSQSEYRRSFHEMLKLKDDGELKQRCRKAAVDLFSVDVGVKRYQEVYSDINS